MKSPRSILPSARLNRSNPARSNVVVSAAPSDADLVSRAQLGERGAFDLLVLKYQRRILSLALRHTRNPSDAEDASQEAFINAYKGLRRFRGECTFYTWLHRITTNCAKNVLRARARAALSSTSVAPYDDAARFAGRPWEPETPEELTITDDVQSVLIAALDALPEALCAAITSREIDGLTYEQIATATAAPIGTVRSRVFRAREMIDHRLRSVFDGGLGRRGRRKVPDKLMSSA
jgi:RNA polymerase sigma-70 factor, ECF subfamily